MEEKKIINDDEKKTEEKIEPIKLTQKERLFQRMVKEKSVLKGIENEIRNLDRKSQNRIKNYIGKGVVEVAKALKIEFTDDEIIFYVIGLVKEEFIKNKLENKEKFINEGKKKFVINIKNHLIRKTNSKIEEGKNE